MGYIFKEFLFKKFLNRNAWFARSALVARTALSALIALSALTSLSACNHLLYYPSRIQFTDPANFKLKFEEVRFQSKDGTKLFGWYFAGDPAKYKNRTIIQFHGNAENISTHYLSTAWLTKEGYNLFIFDYRGYGQSEGEPNSEGVYQDAIAAYDYLLTRVKPSEKIILYGQSLGSAVILGAFHELKSRDRVELFIVEGGFASYQSIGRQKMSQMWLTWLFQPLAYVILSDSTSGKNRIGEISPIPLLVIHGNQDSIVPFEQGMKVYEAAKFPKMFWTIKNGEHMDTWARDKGMYRPILLRVLADVSKSNLPSEWFESAKKSEE